MNNRADQSDRREFLRGLTLMGSAGLVGLRPDRALAEPPPETTRIRLVRSPAICISPLYLAEELLRLEGFTEIEYVRMTGSLFTQAGATGQVDLAVDRPWSQYFCCMAYTNRDFARRYPIATKRALRAVLKAADLCATDPVGAAQTVVTKGYTREYDYAFPLIKSLPYDRWRAHNPEDSLRFYALRLHEAGMIKSSPHQIIAQGTDWRFLNELKKELKG